jgi:hypothetical protein
MRALAIVAIVAIAAALVGCNPNVGVPEAETTAGLGYTQPDPTVSCFAFDPGPAPLRDRWNGQRGYVIYHTITRYCVPDFAGDYAVIGLDPTMTRVVWQTEVADLNGVRYYQTLPGTMTCPLMMEAGQVGTQNTDTGGNHGCDDSACIPNTSIDALRARCGHCVPLTPAQACANAGAQCGSVSDGCSSYVSCGSCRIGFTCDDTNSCTRTCAVRHCPKGSYFNSDDCACEAGLPQ